MRAGGRRRTFDARRFRLNIVVETGAAASGFVEDEWIGQTLEIGDGANGGMVKIVAMNWRCAA
jgi:uncharacterized protein YcbX